MSAKSEIDYIKSNLGYHIGMLKNVRDALGGSKFQGIGTQQCADSLDEAIKQYQKVLKKLGGVDYTKVTAKGQGAFGGGGSGGGIR